MKRFLITALVLSSISFTASARNYMGYKVVDFPFPIAGGEIVRLPTTDAGPIPAENRKAKIEVAGFSVGPSKEDPKKAVLIWQFGFTAKRLKLLESVEVAEVSPSKVAVPLVIDSDPELNDNYWKAGVLVGRETTPWLYEEKATIYVFRFTLKEKNKKTVVLYQPAWFSASAKEKFRAIAVRLSES